MNVQILVQFAYFSQTTARERDLGRRSGKVLLGKEKYEN
jgi:hypothetical protein